MLNEVVVTDLVFNFDRADWGVVGLYVRAMGLYGSFGTSPLLRLIARDRVLAREGAAARRVHMALIASAAGQ